MVYDDAMIPVGEGEAKEEKTKELVPPQLPPEPISTWQPPAPTPVERPGQGVNKKVSVFIETTGLLMLALLKKQ